MGDDDWTLVNGGLVSRSAGVRGSRGERKIGELVSGRRNRK